VPHESHFPKTEFVIADNSSSSAQLQSLNLLVTSTYYFHLLRSWMQLIQFSIFNFYMSFLISSSHLFFGLPFGRIDIGFHLHTFFTILSSSIDVNGQTSLIVALSCDLLCSYVLLIHLLLLIINTAVLWSLSQLVLLPVAFVPVMTCRFYRVIT